MLLPAGFIPIMQQDSSTVAESCNLKQKTSFKGQFLGTATDSVHYGNTHLVFSKHPESIRKTIAQARDPILTVWAIVDELKIPVVPLTSLQLV